MKRSGTSHREGISTTLLRSPHKHPFHIRHEPATWARDASIGGVMWRQPFMSAERLHFPSDVYPSQRPLQCRLYLRRAPKLSYLYDRIWDPKVTAAWSVYPPHRSGNTLRSVPWVRAVFQLAYLSPSAESLFTSEERKSLPKTNAVATVPSGGSRHTW